MDHLRRDDSEKDRQPSPPVRAPADLEAGKSTLSGSLTVQRVEDRDGNGVAAGAEAAVTAASGSSGSALPATLQRKFERSLQVDLSGVRVHNGGASAAANQAVGAKAYTLGTDIHFGAGNFDPSSPAGEHLLAHEVAHTVQQAGGAVERKAQHKLEVSAPHDHAEYEADHAADAMVAGRRASVSGQSGLARKIMRTEEQDLGTAATTAQTQMQTQLQAQPPAQAQVSVVRDVSDANTLLTNLNSWDANLEEGRSSGHVTSAQIIANTHVKNALSDFMSSLGEQNRTLSDFQVQFQRCHVDFARIQGMMAQFQATRGGVNTSGPNTQAGGAQTGASILSQASGGETSAQMGARMTQVAASNPNVGGAMREVQRIHTEMQTASSTLASTQLQATASHNNVVTAISSIEAGCIPREAGAPEERRQLGEVRAQAEAIKGYVRMVTNKLAEAASGAATAAGVPAGAASAVTGQIPALGDMIVDSFYEGQISTLENKIAIVEATRSDFNVRSQVSALRSAKTLWLAAINALSTNLQTFNNLKEQMRSQTAILASSLGGSGNSDLATAARFLGELDPFVAQADATIGLGEAEINAASHATEDRRSLNGTTGANAQAGMQYYEPYRFFHHYDGWHYHAMQRPVSLYGTSESTTGHAMGPRGANPVTEAGVNTLRQYKEVCVGFRREVGQALGMGDLGSGRVSGPATAPSVAGSSH